METWRERTAEQWVQALSEGEPAARDSVPNVGAITQLSCQIELQHAVQARRVRWRRTGLVVTGGIVSIAAAAALWLRATSPTAAPALAEVRALEHAVTLEGAPHEAGLSVGRQLSGGDTLATGDTASVALAVAGGGTLTLSGFSELRLIAASDNRRLGGARLGRGSVEVDLPEQPAGEHFSVNTPDARVTVVGTKFSVRVAEGPNGPVTCVTVTHGRVRVNSASRQALLEAGHRWVSRGELSSCDATHARGAAVPDPSAVQAPSVSPEPPNMPSVARRSTSGNAASSEGKSGTLAEENRLFLELVRARQDGQSDAARALQRTFLKRYPASPLSAQVREEQRKTQ